MFGLAIDGTLSVTKCVPHPQNLTTKGDRRREGGRATGQGCVYGTGRLLPPSIRTIPGWIWDGLNTP